MTLLLKPHAILNATGLTDNDGPNNVLHKQLQSSYLSWQLRREQHECLMIAKNVAITISVANKKATKKKTKI